MGASTSKSAVRQEANKVIINESTVNIVNQQLTTMVANAIVKDAATCGADLLANQSVKIKKIKAKGDIKITGGQEQTVKLNFSCVQASKVRNDVANDMVAKMMAGLETNTSADILDKLEAMADAKTKQELGALGYGASDSKVESIQNYKQITKTNKNIENIIKTSVETNFTSETVKNCLSKMVATQEVELDDLEAGGDFVFEWNQKQAVEMIAECVQQSDVVQDITSKVLNDLKVETKDTSSTKVETEMKGKATSSTESTGFASMISAVTGLFASIFGAYASPFIACSSSLLSLLYYCCCCFILIMVVVMMRGMGGGGEGQSNQSSFMGNLSNTVSQISPQLKEFTKTFKRR